MAITNVTTSMGVLAATDAAFRMWGKAHTDTLDALGLTEDYSNIDWTTVTMPTVANTYAGKRVYKFNDSLSSTREIYVMFEFGRGSTSFPAVGFQVRVTVGTSHSAGTVTGSLLQHYYTTWNTSPDTGEMLGVKTDFGFALFMNYAWSTYNFSPWVVVERAGLNGSPSTDAAILAMCGGMNDSTSTSPTAMPIFHVANYKGGAVLSSMFTATGVLQAVSSSSTSVFEGKFPVLPVVTFGGYDPLYGVVGVPWNSVSASNIFDATVNGVLDTFRTLPSAGGLDTGSATCKVRTALRWA